MQAGIHQLLTIELAQTEVRIILVRLQIGGRRCELGVGQLKRELVGNNMTARILRYLLPVFALMLKDTDKR